MAEIKDKREIGYFFLENSLVDRDDLEPMERLIYMVLARHANGRGECFPSRERLLKVTGLKDKRTVTKYINKLIEKRFLEMTKRQGKSNLYFLKNIPSKPKNVPTYDVPGSDKPVDANNVTDSNKPDTKDVPTSDAPGTNNVATLDTSDVTTGRYMKCTPKETKFKETKIRNNNKEEKENSVVVSALRNEINIKLREYGLNIKTDAVIKASRGDIEGALKRLEAFKDKSPGFIIAAIRDKYEIPEVYKPMSDDELARKLAERLGVQYDV